MKCQFALFEIHRVFEQDKAVKIYQPRIRNDIDAGYDIDGCFVKDLYLDYLQPLCTYRKLPLFALLKYFAFQDTFYVSFLPLAFPSPTSFQSGRFYSQIFDSLLFCAQNSFHFILGSTIHQAIQCGLCGDDVQYVFDKAYYGSDYFLENPEDDQLTRELHDQCIKKCQECIETLAFYAAEITNERHVISTNLSLQGKIDIYGVTESSQLVVELKTRSRTYSRETHNKQLALYVYEALQFPANLMYCTVWSVMEPCKHVFLADNERYVVQRSFFDEKQKPCFLLLQLLNVLVQERNIYIISYYLLLEYIKLENQRNAIAQLFAAFCRRQDSQNDVTAALDCVQQMCRGNALCQLELAELEARLEQILQLELHKRAVSFSQDEVMSNQPCFSVIQQECELRSGVKTYKYRLRCVGSQELCGSYRLTETVDNIVQRNYIFCSISDGVLQCSSMLFSNALYHAERAAGVSMRGISTFNSGVPRSVQIGKFWHGNSAAGRILVVHSIDRRFHERNAEPRQRICGEYSVDREAYYASYQNRIVLSFDQYANQLTTYQNRELYIDARLPGERLAFCVLSHERCCIEADTLQAFERAIVAIERFGIEINRKTPVVLATVDLD